MPKWFENITIIKLKTNKIKYYLKTPINIISNNKIKKKKNSATKVKKKKDK